MRLAGARGPPCAAGRVQQPWMPMNLSKAVGHAGRYGDQGWVGDLRSLGAQIPPRVQVASLPMLLALWPKQLLDVGV